MTLGSFPLRSCRHSVEREIPNASIVSAIVSKFSAITAIVSEKSQCFIRLQYRT